jgi:hypothetical protein
MLLDIIHRPVFYLNTTFRWLDSVSSYGEAYSIGPNIYIASFCLGKQRQRETRDSLRVQGPTDYVLPEDGDRMLSPKHYVLNNRQDDG